VPEPSSRKYDQRRAHLRKDAEDRGVPDQHANDEADKILQEDQGQNSRGPRTTRGEGPEGERGG
jgi:hypothetical protein